jgi:tetratricopeptide (TPR) repeat protein
MSCNRFKNLDFQGFCQGSQTKIEKLAFMSHLRKCLECGLKFLIYIDSLLDNSGDSDSMAEIATAQPRSIEFLNELVKVTGRADRDKISIEDAREALFMEGELPVPISEPPGYYCDRWEEAAFERYANQKATTEDIAEVHGHAEKCEACNVRFLFPLQDEYEQSSLESSREDDEMYEAAWQRFMKLPMPVRATAQQAPIEQATEKAAAKLIPLPNKKGSVRRECQEWQHIEVDKFRQNYYSWETMAQMSEHMLNCTDCLNKFMSPLHPQIDAEKRSDDRKDEELILRGPHAQQVAEDYSKIYFRASKKKITNLEAAQELIAEGEIAAIPRALIPGNSFPEVIGRIIESNENALVNKSVATAASKDIDKSQGASNKESETTNKVVSINRNAPAKKNGRNYIKYLQVAALVLVALLPIVVVYKLFYSPLSNRQDGMAISKIITDTAKLDVNQAAENYEAMNEENRLNKDVKTVLAGNAANLEKLLLLEDALEQYKQLLPLAKQDGEKQLVEKKIADLEKQLNPGAQKPTRYESLQEALDQYLEAVKNSDTATAGVAMDKAEAIAKEMEDKTGEKFGADTILFYKSKVTSREVAARLIAGHTVLKEIQQNRGSLDFRKQYQRAAEAAKSFAEVKANCDLELANIQVSIFLSLLDKDSFDQAQKLLKENVVNTKLSKHLFNQAQFLALLGKNLGKSSQYAEAIEAYTASVELSKNLDVPKFYLYPIQGLAYIYMSLNDDQQTFNLAYGAFQSAIQSKDNLRLMDLSQALGVSAFNLHYSKVAEKYFNYQAKIAQQSNHSQGLARSKAILGIIKAELGEFSKAEKNLADAQQIVDQISDASAHNFIQFYVTGYYARVKMISGNADEAINLYQKTLELGLAANIKESLPLSQLHQGLAECYMAKGQPQLAKTQLQVAENYASEARTHLEVQNALLTFAATHKSIADQLKTIENN